MSVGRQASVTLKPAASSCSLTPASWDRAVGGVEHRPAHRSTSWISCFALSLGSIRMCPSLVAEQVARQDLRPRLAEELAAGDLDPAGRSIAINWPLSIQTAAGIHGRCGRVTGSRWRRTGLNCGSAATAGTSEPIGGAARCSRGRGRRLQPLELDVTRDADLDVDDAGTCRAHQRPRWPPTTARGRSSGTCPHVLRDLVRADERRRRLEVLVRRRRRADERPAHRERAQGTRHPSSSASGHRRP